MNLDIPMSIRALPIDPVRKVPVPWFVAWIDGKPEFRVADGAKIAVAVREHRCWVCGGLLDNRVTFLIGPMCVINRVSSEPPSHPGCAEYSARACPFLSRPGMCRREGGLPEEADAPGIMIDRNPGVTCLWTTRSPGAKPFNANGTGILFRLFPPTDLSWWAESRAATQAEVDASVASGLPLLKQMAEQDPRPGALDALDLMMIDALPLLRVG